MDDGATTHRRQRMPYKHQRMKVAMVETLTIRISVEEKKDWEWAGDVWGITLADLVRQSVNATVAKLRAQGGD